MSKTLRNVSAAVVGAGMLGAAVLLPVSQVAEVWADTTVLSFGFNVENTDSPVIISLSAFSGDVQHPVDVNTPGNGLMAISGSAENTIHIAAIDGANHDIDSSRISVTCASTQSCVMNISGVDTSVAANGIHFSTPGGSPIEIRYLNDTEYLPTMTNLLQNENFLIRYREPQQFDGDAYAIWACGEDDDEVCLHLISGVTNEDGETEYYAASTITDVRDNSRTFNRFGDLENEDNYRGMANRSSVEKWVTGRYGDGTLVANIDWSAVDIHEFLRGVNPGDYEQRLIDDGTCDGGASEETLHRCVDKYLEDHGLNGVKLQPVGETQGANSYTSFGNRQFRITIYDDAKYKAIELGDLDELHYIPSYFQNGTYVDAIDVSSTTAEHPAIMHSVLLEDTVSIKALAVNGFVIEKIEALDVPTGAVDIEKNGNVFNIVFNSNFFDDVVLKITDTAGTEYYLEVQRSILDTWLWEDSVWTTLRFDKNDSHDDFEVIATYAYKDGTFVKKVMENAQYIDDGYGNIEHVYEKEDGQNLKIASFKIQEERGYLENLEGVYYSVRRVGSTSTNYAGTLTGSGMGVFEPVPGRR